MARGPIEDIYPLTGMQRAMLVRCLSYPDQPVYMGQWWALIEGPLDRTAFCAAWGAVIQRHAALRSGIHWDTKKDPFQAVLSAPAFQVETLDWSDRADWRATLQSFLAADRATPFDLKRPPLMRVRLVALAPDRHIVVWTRHHLVVDGWSLGLIVDEVLGAYRGLAAAPALAFRRYVEWDNGRNLTGARKHWSRILDGYHPPETMIEPAGTAPSIGERVIQLSQAIGQRLSVVATSERLTMSTLVEGAWGLVLARAAGVDDVLFGCVETVRPPELLGDQSAHLVGPQIGIQPARIAVDDTPLRDWLARLQASRAAGREAGHVGLDVIRDMLDLPRNALPVASLLAVQTYPLSLAGALRAAGLTLVESVDVSLPDMPLNLMVEIADGLSIRLMFDQRHVTEAHADQLLAMMVRALEGLTDGLDRPASGLDVLPPSVVRTLTEDFAGATLEVGAETVPGIILRHIRTQPDALAVLGSDRDMTHRAMTYRDMGAYAAAVAASLVARGAGRGSRVALVLDRSPRAVAAIVGIEFAGASYVPIDPDAPAERRAQILEAAAVSAVVTDRAHASSFGERPVVAIEDIVPDAAALEAIKPSAPEQEAYLIFTSGSTGRPKGVSVGHDNLRYHVAASAAETPDLPVGRFLLTFPLFFDGSVTGLFCTFTQGGTLVLPTAEETQDPDRLVALVRKEEITHVCMTPSFWRLLLDAAGTAGLPALRQAKIAAEPCPSALVSLHARVMPHVALCNEYGPTEGTVWVSMERCRPETIADAVPIGHAIAGTRLYVLDHRERLCPIGTTGELVIAGPAVARAYVGADPSVELRWRANPFSSDPAFAPTYRTGDRVSYGFDGRLYFHGRRDRQLKIGGYRIEPGEVEAALMWSDGVVEAAVVAEQRDGSAARLVAHIAGDSLPGDEELRRVLSSRLPSYMFPQAFVRHVRLARSGNGKIEYGTLPLSDAAATPAEAPVGDRETALAGIWQDLLGLNRVGRHDDFFMLGGSSLLAMQMIARIRRDLTIPAEISDLFEAPRIADLALRLKKRAAAGAAGTMTIAPRRRARVDLPP